MKRRFTILTAALALLVSLAIPMGMWGQTKMTYKLTIDASDFNSTSYAANNNEKTSLAVCITDNTKTYEVNWTSYQIMLQSNDMQWQKNAGKIYNSTNLGTITNVTVTSSAGTFTTYYGTSEQPAYGNSGAGKGFFKTFVGGATGKSSKVEVLFEIEESGSDLEESDLALSNALVALSFDLYNNTSAQTISYTTSSTGEVTVADSDYITTVVDQTNKTITVTPVAVTNGAKVITVNQAADDNYAAGSKTFTVNITNSAPYVQPTEIEIIPNYTFWGKTASFSGSTYDDLSGSQDNVTLDWTRGSGSMYANTTAMRFYKDNDLTFTAPEGYEIISIALTVSGTYSDLTFSPTGYDNETTTWTGAAETVTMSRPSNATSYATISKFTITLAPIGSAVTTTTTINVPSVFNNDIYQGTNAGILTATVTPEGGSALDNPAITWSSSNTGVATIDANGAVTLVAVGTTTITAIYAGVTDQYKPSSATYSLEVTDSTPVLEATFIFNTDEGLADLNITKPNAGFGTDLDANHDYVIGIVTMNVTHASTPTRIWGLSGGATELRAYSGSTLTFRVPSGYAVTKVTFTGSALPYSELTNGVWTSTGDPVSTVTFNCTNTAKVSTITVEYEENASIVAAPTLPASTNFYPEMTVEITNNTSGATVYYTTDGSDPKTSNTRIEYTQAFTLNATTTVKAVALKDSNYSQVVEATYTLVDVLDSMQVVFNAAGDETTNVFINFNNYVVSGVSTNGKSVFVTDNSGNGFVIFNNNGGLDQTYSVGSILSGTAVPCNLVKYNGFAELLNVDASNLTITAGGTVSTSNIAMADLAGINTGALVSYENLTCSVDNSGDTPKYYLTDGTTTLQVYNSLYAFNALENGKKYNITGVYQQYNNTKEILPRSAADIVPIFPLIINGYGEDSNPGGYYLIASPLGTINPANVPDMLSDTYDLYYFDQNTDGNGNEWINYKGGSFNLEPGTGYLYAHNSTITLNFTGTPIEGTTYDVTLRRNERARFKGWNLVGNPFTKTAYIDNTHNAYYTMDAAGALFIPVTSNSVDPMEGVFVVAKSDEEIITFRTTNPNEVKCSTLALNLSQGQSLLDRAIVRFDEGSQLPKLQFNRNSSKVCIPMDDEDYAVVRAEEMGEMPVNFKAESNGTYSLNFGMDNVEFAYLHLIDNLTGNEVDLLQTPSYSFEAKTTDYENRFKLVFATGDNSNEDNFAYFSNGSFVINNEGNATLQVIDITGRIVKSESVNGCANVNVNGAAGVYMLRLVNGDNVKVQKVVVK